MRLHAKTTLVAICMAAVTLLFNGCTVYIFGLSQTSAYGDLILNFESDRSQVREGEAVHVRFTIKNVGDKPYVVESQDTPVLEITVGIVGDGGIASWSVQNPASVSHRLEWQPGESKVIEWTWTPQKGDVYSGAFRDIHFSGILNKDSKLIQAAGVTLCASNICR